ncbi:hypothetical protein GCM10023214_60600 [Amycolatopsis dongchuanensis]|uniref:NlpC/P60 domain-containing protein n=1 Tax=Amycolatopsis dongchuanensis TaxID=1070866 RepID=A0ABP8VDS9_9PSEU
MRACAISPDSTSASRGRAESDGEVSGEHGGAGFGDLGVLAPVPARGPGTRATGRSASRTRRRCRPCPARSGPPGWAHRPSARTRRAGPTSAALTAINYACGQRGLPYIWGGDGPDSGDRGFDCSGLTKAAYDAAGITLPRTAHAHFHTGPHVPGGSPLLPGDLVFYGTPARITHVALYLGNSKMINAPTFGSPVQIDNYHHPNDDYVGATRPSR